MNLEFTEEQSILREAVRRFAEEELKPRISTVESAKTPSREMVSQMAELGLSGMLVPDEHGGAGTDTLSFVVVITELARVHASTAVTLLIHNLVAELLCSLGSDKQLKNWIPDLLTGSQLATLALSENGSGLGLGRVRSRACQRDGAYLLEGRKPGVSSALSADVFMVSVSLEQPKGTPKAHAGLFWVPAQTPGVSVSRPTQTLGLRGLGTADVVFEDCELREACLVRSGFTAGDLGRTRDLFRIGTAAVALGLADGAREAAGNYARERRQFGRPIIRFQAIEFMLADMSIEAEAARQLLYRAAWLRDQGRDCRVAAAQSCLFGTDSARRITNKALQIHGGYGYLSDYPVERFFRDARSLELLEELPEAQRQTIAEPMLAGVEGSGGNPGEKERSGF